MAMYHIYYNSCHPLEGTAARASAFLLQHLPQLFNALLDAFNSLF